jgi:hypothetical protein
MEENVGIELLDNVVIPMISNTDPATLTKALLRAAEHLGLTQHLAEILDVGQEVIASIMSGQYTLDPTRDEWIAATRFTGLFRSLLVLTGSAEAARRWLASEHQTLGAAPCELLLSPDGRDKVFKYLDHVQKHEMKLPPRSTH